MKKDWKGLPAIVVVGLRLQDGATGEFVGAQVEVARRAVMLDTDTMADLFDEFFPGTHDFEIFPEEVDDGLPLSIGAVAAE